TQYNFTLTTVYWGLLTYSAGSDSYAFDINPFPVIDKTYNATVSSTISYSGGWSGPKISSPFNNTSLQTSAYVPTSSPFKPYNTTVWTIIFASATSQNLFAVSAGRTITITPSDSVQVTDA